MYIYVYLLVYYQITATTPILLFKILMSLADQRCFLFFFLFSHVFLQSRILKIILGAFIKNYAKWCLFIYFFLINLFILQIIFAFFYLFFYNVDEKKSPTPMRSKNCSTVDVKTESYAC